METRKLSYLDTSAAEAAPMLLGSYMHRTISDGVLTARIVETEAYDQSDLASHSYNGSTPRTEVMFGPSGRLYVYFTYGMHYCCNVVVGVSGQGAAVLIRAVEPVTNIEVMERNRGGLTGASVTNGPAKLCQALGIDKQLNGHDLTHPPLQLVPGGLRPEERIVQTTRIGISKATSTPWRFYIANNPYVSKPSTT